MTPFFSIIIPLYNKESFITETLKSVLKQSYKNFEVILVNDGSTDKSLENAILIKDSRIKVYTIKNNGVSFARNYGIKKATAENIVFLDADDYWFPNHLKTLDELYKKFPNSGLYGTAYEKRHLNHITKSVYNNIPKKNNWMGIVDDFFESSLVNSIASSSSIMIPRNVFMQIGDFDENVGSGEDTDLWIRIALKYPIAFSNNITVTINLHAENRISDTNINSRKLLNLDQYEKYITDYKSLKVFLDYHRYYIAIQFKLANSNNAALPFLEKIKLNSLNWKQRVLLKMNYTNLVLFLKLKKGLKCLGLNLSTFK